MLAAPCFVNEGSTTVYVPHVRGYAVGCPELSAFSCAASLADGGRNQRCVACVTKRRGRCHFRTMFDASCG